MHPLKTVEFWNDIFAAVRSGMATRTLVDIDTGEVLARPGDAIDDDIAARLEQMRRENQHARRVNGADRQVCCQMCHDCGSRLHEVLDGELWCVVCEAYR